MAKSINLKKFKNLLIESIYPKGSIYTTIDSTFDPNETFGGNWEKMASGKCLFGANESHVAGSEIDQGLPSLPTITGSSHNHNVSITHATPGHGSGGNATIEGTYSNTTA